MKFGGTSVGNAQNIASVGKIVASQKKQTPIVVVSAVTKITDTLIQLYTEALTGGGYDTLTRIHTIHEGIVNELGLDIGIIQPVFDELDALVIKTQQHREASKSLLDHFQSFGERLCARIVSAEIAKKMPSKPYDAWDIGMITNDVFGDAEPLQESYGKIKHTLAKLSHTPVITGFIGKTKNGSVVTLGRGGSDYTTAIIGAAVQAKKIQIWKEVDGVLTTDPRIVPKARLLDTLTFEEASELAYFGAKVLHPKTILPAMQAHVPVQVLNTFNPKGKGTTIISTKAKKKAVGTGVKAFTFKKGTTVITIMSPEFFDGNGLMAKIFTFCEAHAVSVDVVATSVVSVSVSTTNTEGIDALCNDLRSLGEVAVSKGNAVVCAVGLGMDTAAVSAKAFGALSRAKIPVSMISESASSISLTFLVSEQHAPKAIQILHKTLIG